MNCKRCGRSIDHVKVWPLHCSCGLVTYQDGYTRSAFRRGLGDWLADVLRSVGVRKREGCKCQQRQEALNRWSSRLPYLPNQALHWLAGQLVVIRRIVGSAMAGRGRR